jgi:hypothetical protein
MIPAFIHKWINLTVVDKPHKVFRTTYGLLRQIGSWVIVGEMGGHSDNAQTEA